MPLSHRTRRHDFGLLFALAAVKGYSQSVFSSGTLQPFQINSKKQPQIEKGLQIETIVNSECGIF